METNEKEAFIDGRKYESLVNLISRVSKGCKEIEGLLGLIIEIHDDDLLSKLKECIPYRLELYLGIEEGYKSAKELSGKYQDRDDKLDSAIKSFREAHKSLAETVAYLELKQTANQKADLKQP
jgi:hypothetical protein